MILLVEPEQNVSICYIKLFCSQLNQENVDNLGLICTYSEYGICTCTDRH
jgi:hypothetical protein